jgi:hypothetical protein
MKQVTSCSGGGGDMLLRNIDYFPTDYRALHPRSVWAYMKNVARFLFCGLSDIWNTAACRPHMLSQHAKYTKNTWSQFLNKLLQLYRHPEEVALHSYVDVKRHK